MQSRAVRRVGYDCDPGGVLRRIAVGYTSDEMFAAMRKTSMSAIIYEVLDMGTGITDARGEIASSGAGIPAFIGVLDKSVKAILGKFSYPATIHPGDVFATNDPYYGGVTHLNDVIFAMPVFAEGEIALHRMLYFAPSMRSTLIRPTTAIFAAP